MSKTSKLTAARKREQLLKNKIVLLEHITALREDYRQKYEEVLQIISEVCHSTHPLHAAFKETYLSISGHELDFLRTQGAAIPTFSKMFNDPGYMTLNPEGEKFQVARVYPLIVSYYKVSEDAHQVMFKLRYKDESAVLAMNEAAMAMSSPLLVSRFIARKLAAHLIRAFKPTTTEQKVL
jgi:hypothetical protein